MNDRKTNAAAVAGRSARIERATKETRIVVAVNLDGTGRAEIATGVPFLDHMLDQVARHGMLDLSVQAKGDLHIDAHHTVEDIGITLGQAVRQALGDKAGICRYGHAYVPLDEALSRVVIDLSGRPGPRVPRAIHSPDDRRLRRRSHARVLPGLYQSRLGNAAHRQPARARTRTTRRRPCSRHFARALRIAVAADPRASGVPSTKGIPLRP